jgi:MFS family permease
MYDAVARSVKISLLMLATMGVMSGIAIVADLPLISHHFAGIAHIEFLSKLLLTVPSLVIALVAPFAGMIIDRYGRLRPLYTGVVLFVIGGSSGFYLEHFYAILAGRALLGFSVALIMTASTALIGDYFDNRGRHRFMSMQGMAVGLGGIVFILSGGYLAQLGWDYPFVIYLLPILFLPLLLRALYEPNRLHTHVHDEEAVSPKLLPVYLSGFFSMLLFYMLPTQMPYLVVDELHGTPSSIGHFVAFALLVNALTSRQYARIKARFGYAQIFVFIYLFFGTGLLVMSLVTAPHQLFFASAFMGVGFGLVMVNINAWLLSRVPAHRRGRAVGVLTMSFFLGQFFSPIVFQPFVAFAGIQGLFLAIACVSFITAGVLYVKTFLLRDNTSVSG